MAEINQDMEIRIYTKWINSKLGKEHTPVKNLIEDLQDGLVLISLLEVLLNKKINSDVPKSEIDKRLNIQKVLELLEKKGLKLPTINTQHIVNGNNSQILALVWEIILHFQICGVVPDEQGKTTKPKNTFLASKSRLSQVKVEERLKKWMQNVLQGESEFITVDDLERSWYDGWAFVYLLYVFRPSSVDINKAKEMSVEERLEYLFHVAEKKFGVPSLLDPLDVEEGNVDKERMLIYFSSLYEVLRNIKIIKMNEDIEICIYTKWINSKLGKEHIPVKNLIEDLQDGLVLISLLEVLLNKKINTEEPKLKIHKLVNIKKVLVLLKERGLKLPTIKTHHIVNGNDTQILALVWKIILHFQICGVVPDEQGKTTKPKNTFWASKSRLSQVKVEKRLKKWMQNVLQGVSEFIMVDDLENSWYDGWAFVYLLYVFRPTSVDKNKAEKMSVEERLSTCLMSQSKNSVFLACWIL
ncbi:spectrin beta chain, erythrocytic-like isoform X2 [Xenia sp. Carnegie-2017]|uniref:spectrin beta chain, erythrocytic-like isoform X2 n=1 Tax=Xenia sp. Carnegie-2017 TaxID=2897299 RepID=UPI001F04D550|nr:spectrin beta chain, erythrocytic-like isoform X2 [Xenia sp. Carnegie-2017]